MSSSACTKTEDRKEGTSGQKRLAKGCISKENHSLPFQHKEAIFPSIGHLLDKISNTLSSQWRAPKVKSDSTWTLTSTLIYINTLAIKATISTMQSLHIMHIMTSVSNRLLLGCPFRAAIWHTLQTTYRSITHALKCLIPENIFRSVLVPISSTATITIIRNKSDNAPIDSVVWVKNGQEVLWTHGSFSKGILSRSSPTWAPRFLSEIGAEDKEPRVYLEDMTRIRREKRVMERNEGGNNLTDTSSAIRIPADELDVRPDEAKLMEPAQLSSYETLFLTYIGCLEVKDKDGVYFDYLSLCRLYLSIDSRTSDGEFIRKYAAYYYYRSRGWTVRSGLKYAADFVIYRQGPVKTHSEFAVIVRPMNGSSKEPAQVHNHELGSSSASLSDSWQHLYAVVRVCGQARKSVLVCHVAVSDVSTEAIDPSSFQIKEISVKRFNPDRARK